MANIDVVARLQLRAEQFSSETGQRFAELKTRAASSAQEIRQSFGGAFAEVQRLAGTALQAPRLAGGGLDLSGTIADLNRQAEAADVSAQALRALSVAQSAVAESGRGNAEAMRTEADAAAVGALAEERNAQAIRDRIAALNAVQGELANVSVATRRGANDDDEVAHASGRASIAKMELMHVVRASTDAFAAGAPITQIFSQEIGRLGQAAASAGGGEGALGAMGAFMMSGWGIAAVTAVSVLTPFVAKLFETSTAADQAVAKLREQAQQAEIDRTAHEAFSHSLDGLIANEERLTDTLKRQLETRRELNQEQVATTRGNLSDASFQLDLNTQRVANWQASYTAANEAVRIAPEGADMRAAMATRNNAARELASAEHDLAQATTALTTARTQSREAEAYAARQRSEELAQPGGADRVRLEDQRRQNETQFGNGLITRSELDARDSQIAAAITALGHTEHGPSAGEQNSLGGMEALLRQILPGVRITSSTGGRHVAGSDHYAGRALDFVPAGGMGQFSFDQMKQMLEDAGVRIRYGSGGTQQFFGPGHGPRGPSDHSHDNHFHVAWEGSPNPQNADQLAQRTQERAARAAQELLTYNQRNADTVAGINSRWDEQPKLIDQARADAQHLDEIIAAYRDHTGEAAHATADQSAAMIASAEAAKQTIVEGVNRPFTDYVRSQRESLAVQQLTLQGRDAEASALQTALRLQDQMGPLTHQQLADIQQSAEAQQRIADALDDQRRVVNLYTGAVGDAQKVFDSFLSTLQSGNTGSAFKSLIAGATNTFATLQRNLLSNAIFGGVDRDVERYVRQMTGQQTPAEILQDQSRDAAQAMSDGVDRNVSALDRLTTAFNSAGGRLRDGLNPISASGGDSSDGFGADIVATSRGQYAPANDNGGDIIVTGTLSKLDQATQHQLSAAGVMGVMIDRFSTNLEHLGIHIPDTITKGLSRELPGILQGASFGQLGGSVFSSITGGKNNSTASAIGGVLGEVAGKAIGSTVGKAASGLLSSLGGAAGPIGSIVGGILGSVVGGLFKTTPKGSAGIDVSNGSISAGKASGNAADATSAASSLAGSVAQGLQQIADQLGAAVTGSTDVKIGTYDGKWRVNDHGGAIGGVKGSGAISFDTEQEAISYAISDALKDGVLSGISKASLTILQSGQDLSQALQKAMMIEQIPKDLKAMLDPVGAAIDTLNLKWKKQLDALKEGGATADQMAQAQQLYNLQLEQVKASTDSASQGLKNFLQSLKAGSDSPLSLRDQEGAAKAALQPFLDTINAGGSVDQSKYQDAAKAFLDVERQLYGSTQQYFDQFNAIQDATTKAIAAIDNAVPITAGVPDPFTKATADSTATTATNTGTTNDLLSMVSDQLGSIAGLLTSIGGNGNTDLSSFLGTGRNFKATGTG